MKIRQKKETDQEDTEKAYNLLLELIRSNQKEIEPALWVGAMICALSENYEKSGVSFEKFLHEIMLCMNHYRY
jgi:hypothetical protein